MKWMVWLLAAAAVAAVAGWFVYARNDAPEVTFARAAKETLVSTLTTNGKVEPVEYAAVRSESDGPVVRVMVERGARVQHGAVIAVVGTGAAESELADAEAAVAQARADLELYERGGDAAALAEIDNGIRKSGLELEAARREAAALERLVSKNAATRQELQTAQDRVRTLEAEVEGLRKKRASLVPSGGKAAAEARLRQGQSAAALARRRIEQGSVQAPIAGVVYNVAVKPGAFVRAGELVAEIGKLDRVRVVVFVDEPELGRVSLGAPVTLHWDGAPGRSWSGAVDRLPTQVVAMGTRQVGEVLCTIDNDGGVLQPGANVDAEIRTAAAENAVTIPKEAVRREGAASGVFVLRGGRVEWREVQLGVSSVTRVQVVTGVAEGDAVALPGERALRSGDEVNPVFRP